MSYMNLRVTIEIKGEIKKYLRRGACAHWCVFVVKILESVGSFVEPAEILVPDV